MSRAGLNVSASDVQSLVNAINTELEVIDGRIQNLTDVGTLPFESVDLLDQLRLLGVGSRSVFTAQVPGVAPRGRFLQFGTATVGGDTYLSYNAEFLGNTWNRDDTTRTAWMVRLGDQSGDNFSIFHAAAGANPISWSNVFVVNTSGSITVGSLPDSGLSSNVALLNRSQQNFTQGNLFTGTLGAGSGIYRTDAQIELQGTNGLLSVAQTTATGDTTHEAAVAFMANDSAGTKMKTGSLSSKHTVTTASTGYGVMRLNATYAGGATDDVFLRGWGNHGAAFWAASDAAGSAPGAQVLQVNGTGFTKLVQTGSNITGNMFEVLDVRDNTGTYGLFLGYDSTSAAGIISGLASAPVAIWTFNGSAWAARFTVNADGTLNCASTVATYGGQTTAARGVVAELASVTLTAQAAAITTTNLIAAPTAGLYRVSYYHEITQAATVSSATLLTIGWTAAAAKTATDVNITTNTVGDYQSGELIIRVASGAITYATTYTSAGATAMQYGLNITVERLQ